MKNLKEYMIEGIFDVDNNIDDIDDNIIRLKVQEYLDKCYYKSKWVISQKRNSDGKFEVSSKDSVQLDYENNATKLTNEYFVFYKINGDFDCSHCECLETLEGAPQVIRGNFLCYDCPSLEKLDTHTKEVYDNFDISNCTELKSLKGAPEEIGGYFIYYSAGGSITGRNKNYVTPWSEKEARKYVKKIGKGVVRLYEDA